MSHDRFFAVGTNELETREFLGPEMLSRLEGVSSFNLLEPAMRGADARDPLARFATLDLRHYLPDDILTKVDRMSMAHSLELRAPLLDYRLVEFAARLPSRLKIAGGESKVILKRAFGDLLPPTVLKQRKRGFSPPIEEWLREELRPMLDEALHDRRIEEAGFFRLDEMRTMAEEHFSRRRSRRSLLWRFLFFTRWYHKHLEQNAPPVHVATSN